MSKQYNTPDVDDAPPPAYQEVAPPFNPNYNPQPERSPSFNPHFNPHHSPPHTPDLNPRAESSQPLYPQIPVSPSPPMVFPQPQHYQAMPQQQQYQQQQQPRPYHPQHNYYPNQQVRYQAIEIPYTATTSVRIDNIEERSSFPLGAIIFLFGCICPPLWVIGACCCSGSRNKYEAFWGKVNFIMAMALIISSIIFSVISMTE